MFRKRYYIVTVSESNLGLELYYIGKLNKRELAEKIVEIGKTFPFLFLVLSGRGIKHTASNYVKTETIPTAVVSNASDCGKGERVVN